MAFDPQKNIITVGDGQDFLADSGQFFILTLKKFANDTNLSEKARRHSRNEWRVIEEWLGCQDRELNENDMDKIAKAWKAYLAIGLSPSAKLQSTFDHFHQSYKDEGYTFEMDRAPSAVMDVFDRLLATDKEIRAKQKADMAEEASKWGSLLRDLGSTRSNHGSRYQGSGLKGWNVDKEKLSISIAAIWLLLSIPLSNPIHEEFIGENDLLSRIFSWLIVGAAAWVPFGWRWLTNKQPYPRVLIFLAVASGILLMFLFINDRYLEDYFYVPLGATVTFVAIVLSHDGIRLLTKKR